jgi:hypothetical protein
MGYGLKAVRSARRRSRWRRTRALNVTLLATSLLLLGVQHSLRLCDAGGFAAASSAAAPTGCPQHRAAAPVRHAHGGRTPSCCTAGGAAAVLSSRASLASIRPPIAVVPGWAIARIGAAALGDFVRPARIDRSANPPPSRYAGLRSHLALRTILV